MSELWGTPVWLIAFVSFLLWTIDFADVCPYPRARWNALRCSWLTILQKSKVKTRKLFMNPPFDKAGKWVTKARKEIDKHQGLQVVMVLPYKPNARWYQKMAAFVFL